MTKLILRNYTEDDKLKVVELLKRGLTKEFTLERWNWLHHNNVTLGSHIVIAEYDDRIVGTVAAIKKKFRYNEDHFIGGRHLDPVVDTSMRGKGVFTKMLHTLNELCNDVDFSYTFPNAASFRGFAKTGYTSIGPIFMPLCQLNFWGVPLKEKLRFMKTGAKIIRNTQMTVETDEFHALKSLKPLFPTNKYALLRDYNYIKWRYADSPIKSYEVLVTKSHNTIQNACILLRNNTKISIIDFIEYKSEIILLDYLAAIKELYGKVAISVWDSSISDIGKYFVGKSTQNFLVRKGNLQLPKLIFDKNYWFITKGEVEGN